jgi:hypothetical protein
LINIEVANTVRFYNGGVYKPDPKKNDCPNRGNKTVWVMLDGFKVGNDGSGTWNLKFPWGTKFGENGNMSFGFAANQKYTTSNQCGIYDIAYVYSA